MSGGEFVQMNAESAKEPLVTVVVTAYNQADCIGRCLESIQAQKTSFPIRIIVADDASKDGSADIARQYAATDPRISVLVRERNLGANGNPAEALRHVKTKYFHILESDDYWIDETKLQRQVDALEAHPECVVCGHSLEYRKPDGSLALLKGRRLKPGAFRIDTLETTQFVHRSATLFRNLLDEISDEDLSWVVRDVCFFYWMMSKGKIIYFDRPMSVYSITGVGIWSSLGSRARQEQLQDFYYHIDRFLDYKYTHKFRHQYLPHEGKKLFSFSIPYFRKGRRLLFSVSKLSCK